jgi:translation initiation factor 2 subunit 2
MQSLYSTDFLVERLFRTLDAKGTNKKKFSMKRPIVENSNRKTHIKNFEELCNMLNREMDHLKNFIEKETHISSSINEKKVLIIDATIRQPKIEEAIDKYAQKYVVCKEPRCKSGDTEIVKKDRLKFLICKSCGSEKAITADD